MKIDLKDITKENLPDILNLKIAESQKGFVATNAKSLAQSKYYPSFVPLAIYNEEIPVGFVMYGVDDDDNTTWIIRMMIDERYQRCGYGKNALKIIIDRIVSETGCKEIFLSFEPHNDAARKLYESFGFADTGRIEEGEIVYKLIL